MDARLVGILSSMGVPPYLQGKLYWWQNNGLLNEYNKMKEFQAKVGGAKIK